MSTSTAGNFPLVYSKTPTIRLGIVYNPFVINDTSWHELVYDQGKTLVDYLEGLPEEVEWGVAVNGFKIEPDQWAETKLHPGDTLVIIRVPEGGGNTGKTILRIVAMIAVMVVANFAGGMLADMIANAGMVSTAAGMTTLIATMTAVAGVAGAMVVNAILPPQNLNPNSGPQSTSYSIGGPKNTAREGVPVPIVYGTYRVGGNVVDCFTRNIGDDQYLFMRTVLNDGAVSNISELQINGQDIWTFKDVEYLTNLGLPGEQPVSWFNEAIRMNNIQQKISPAGVTYTTQEDVDRLRVDVSFPAGLETVDKGNHKSNTVQLGIQYREMTEDGLTPVGAWAALPLEAEEVLDTSGGTGTYTITGTNKANFTLLPDHPASGDAWAMSAQYKAPGDTTWTQLGTKTGSWLWASTFGGSGDIFSQTPSIPQVNWTINFPYQGDWEVQFTGGAVQDNTVDNPNLNSKTVNNLVGNANSLTVRRETQKPFNLTYQSTTLTRGRYQVMVTRATPESTDINNPDQCWVTDISEIDNENVSYEGTAMLSLKIKLTDQLSSQPTVTALVEGSLVNVYDDDGNILANQYSSNPADIALDVLLNPERGGAVDPTKVIWSKLAEWRDFCTANNLQFNGVFDFVTTMWDALQSVARVGHANFMPQGTRFTVAIDQQSDPVMVFTGSNMYRDTFKKIWVGIDDRANEIQQQFQDSSDMFRQKTIRLPDVVRQSTDRTIKPATQSGFGITGADQATLEAEYQARLNSYIRSSISFDAPIEAIGLSIGDVALIQHDSNNYAGGVGGRLEAGSTASVINLDRPVTMTVGNSYTLLVNTDAILISNATVTAVNLNKVTVTGLPGGTLPRIRRMQQGTHDAEVLKIVDLMNGSWVITLDDATGFVGGAATLWDTDVIQECPVVFVEGQSTTVTLSTPLSGPPAQFANFLFGQAVAVKQPYRLKSLSGDEDLYKRTLNFIQYDDRVYEPGSWGTPILLQSTNNQLGQVRALRADWDKNPLPDQQRIKVSLSWTRPDMAAAIQAYGGADLFYQDNGGNWQKLDTVAGTTWSGDFNRGDVLTFKVVGHDVAGARANFDVAPTVNVSLAVYDLVLDPPHNLAYSIAAWDVKATAGLTWTTSTDNPDTYRVDVQGVDLTTWSAWQAADQTDPTTWPASISGDGSYQNIAHVVGLSYNVAGLGVNKYVVRVRAEKGWAASPWVYLGVDVEAPGLPAQVTGLRLNGGTPDVASATFTGLDAAWTWDDIVAQAAAHPTPGVDLPTVFLDYQVTILDAAGNPIRTEYSSSPTYTYTFGKNAADSASVAGIHARRDFKIKVAIRSKQGQLSLPAIQEAVNPPPAAPTGLDSHEAVGGVVVSWDKCPDPDYSDTIAYMGETADFDVSTATIAFDGPGTTGTVNIPTGGQWFVKLGHRDAFDSTTNLSPGFNLFVPSMTIASLQAISDQGATLQSEIDDLATNALGILVKSSKDQTSLASQIQDTLNSMKAYTDLQAEVIGTVIDQESQQRIDGQTAIAETFSLIGAKSGDGLSFILNTNTCSVSPTESLATRLESIQTSLGGNSTAIDNEVTARSTADTAFTNTLNLIGSKNSDGSAFVLNTTTTQVSPGQSFASWKTGVDATYGNATAYADQQWTVAGKPGYQQAQTLTTVGVDLYGTGGSSGAPGVGSMKASVTTLNSVVNDPTTGLVAKAGVSVDVNGHIAGWQLNNNGSSGSFVVVANQFAFVDPGNAGTVKIPFQYSGGSLYLTNTVVDGSLTVDGTITTTKLIANTVSAPAYSADSTQIYMPNGTSVATGAVLASTPVTCDDADENLMIVFSTDVTNVSTSQRPTAWLVLLVDGNQVKSTVNYINVAQTQTCTHVGVAITPGAGTHTIEVVGWINLSLGTQVYKSFNEFTIMRFKR